jgi:multidrug resistance efflux pump
MEILLTLTYVALCYATFKLFRIPVNQWTLATAALGGVFGLSLLFITMAYNHPFSTNARIYFTVTPVLSGVRGRVIEVPVEDKTNQHLEAGEVLFKIDPKPYEYTGALGGNLDVAIEPAHQQFADLAGAPVRFLAL